MHTYVDDTTVTVIDTSNVSTFKTGITSSLNNKMPRSMPHTGVD